MEQIERNKDILKKYIPEATVSIIAEWVYRFDFKLKIKQARASVYGDYRPPVNNRNHQITINHNLNKYAFLTTLIHEVAHLVAWQKFGNKVQSHGAEWKKEYRSLLYPFLNETVFPPDIISALKKYLLNPSASTCSDLNLFRTLSRYNTPVNDHIVLEDIPFNSHFMTDGHQTFLKVKKLRTRYLCIRINSKQSYVFHPLTQVKPVAESDMPLLLS